MKVAIIGIGAMGSLFAARLSAVAEVVVIGRWPEQLAALKKGLTLIEAGGKTTSYSIPATAHVQEVPPVDLALVLVKSHQTEQAAEQAYLLLSEESPLNLALTLQNGAGNLEKLEAVLGASRSLAGITDQAALMLEPGVVRDSGPGTIYLGSPPSHSEKARKIQRLFTEAGFNTQLSGDIQSLIWGKLAVNAAINPLTAILNRPNGYIGENKITREIMFRLARETAEVAATQGITLPYTDIEQHVAGVAHTTRSNRSSMLKDVLRGVRTEIEAICGEVVRKGEEYGIPTPVNALIFDMVKAIEAGKRNPDPGTDLSWILTASV